jgi:hypothetical protein
MTPKHVGRLVILILALGALAKVPLTLAVRSIALTLEDR